MLKLFRGKFLQGLKVLLKAGNASVPEAVDERKVPAKLYDTDRVVYEGLFGVPHAVIENRAEKGEKVLVAIFFTALSY